LLERRGARAAQGVRIPSSKHEGKLSRSLFMVCGGLEGFTAYIFFSMKRKGVRRCCHIKVLGSQ
jgi:hypothetical protein